MNSDKRGLGLEGLILNAISQGPKRVSDLTKLITDWGDSAINAALKRLVAKGYLIRSGGWHDGFLYKKSQRIPNSINVLLLELRHAEAMAGIQPRTDKSSFLTREGLVLELNDAIEEFFKDHEPRRVYVLELGDTGTYVSHKFGYVQYNTNLEDALWFARDIDAVRFCGERKGLFVREKFL